MGTRALLVPLVVVSAIAPAFGEGPTAKQQAAKHFKNAVYLFEEGKHREALVEFRRAQDLAPHPQVLYNIALSQIALSDYAGGIATLQAFLEKGQGVLSKSKLEQGRAELARIRGLVGTVTVKTDPDGAAVYINGQSMGAAPLDSILLGPGSHRIEARMPGHQNAVRDIQLASGDTEVVAVSLQPAPQEIPVTQDVQARVTSPSASRWIGVSAGFATNAVELADTGLAVVGAEIHAGSRWAVRADVSFPSVTLLPSLRVRAVGDELALYLIGALPVAFDDGETVVAGAGGLSLRWRLGARFALRFDGLLAYGSKQRGVSMPLIVASEAWF